MKRFSMLVLTALALFSILSITTHAQSVRVAHGAGVEAANTTFSLKATLGQSTVGHSAAVSAIATLGFWYPSSRTSTLSDQPIVASPSQLALSAGINPFSDATKLRAFNPTDGHLTLILYDALGKPAMVLLDQHQKAGKLEIEVQAQELPSGHYTATLIKNVQRRSVQLMLIK